VGPTADNESLEKERQNQTHFLRKGVELKIEKRKAPRKEGKPKTPNDSQGGGTHAAKRKCKLYKRGKGILLRGWKKGWIKKSVSTQEGLETREGGRGQSTLQGKVWLNKKSCKGPKTGSLEKGIGPGRGKKRGHP